MKKRKGDKPTKWIKYNGICDWCGHKVKKILDLEATTKKLCGFECERKCWLDIFF